MEFRYNSPTLKVRRRTLRKKSTDAERALWQRLRGRQFHGLKFLRQYSVGPYVVDFYCSKQRLAIELDGSQHMETDVENRDKQRSRYLRSHKIQVLRFWNNEVFQNIEGVLQKVEEAVGNPS